jgi:hypothetical protein
VKRKIYLFVKYHPTVSKLLLAAVTMAITLGIIKACQYLNIPLGVASILALLGPGAALFILWAYSRYIERYYFD